MSAVETVRKNMKQLIPEPGESRDDLAQRMFYLQMEIYSAHAGRDLYEVGDYKSLSYKVKKSWLKLADRKLKSGG